MNSNYIKLIAILLIISSFLISCKQDYFPKPKAQLRLEYKKPNYVQFNSNCPYTFDISSYAKYKINKKCWVNINYPSLKATINITYRPVDGNLKELLVEAEKLTFSHTIKADGISSIPYINSTKKVYGSIYEVTGNAASPVQFHVTDSVKNFITGAVYFNVQPNFDSIKPAISFVQKDIIRLIESLEWK